MPESLRKYSEDLNELSEAFVESFGGLETPLEPPQEPAEGPLEARVIGRIGLPPTLNGPQVPSSILPGSPRITEYVDPVEAAEKAAAREYADLLNRKLSVRHRANLMVKIAKNVSGANAALALRALQDINLATGVVNKSGLQVDLGPMFMLPEGSDVKAG